MVGLIHRLLLEMLHPMVGAEGITRILQQAGIPADTEFRLDTNYPEAEFDGLLQAILDETGLPQPQLEQIYARFFLADAKKRWPTWFSMSANGREFLLRQPKIHNGFASAMLNEADRSRINDKFMFEEGDSAITVHYRSPHRLCGLFKCLAQEVLDHYQEQARISESLCLKQGDRECCIHIAWEDDHG